MNQSYEKCDGCKNDQPNQLAHINCPYGCLHIYTNCSVCNLVQKYESNNKSISYDINDESDECEYRDSVNYDSNHEKTSDDDTNTNENTYIDCDGCLNEQPGQLAHMDCLGGCLHSNKTCFRCNYC